MYTKEQLESESKTLENCPFCDGHAEFITNKAEQIILQHFPINGVTCPARYYQYCETFDQGREFWNKRWSINPDIN